MILACYQGVCEIVDLAVKDSSLPSYRRACALVFGAVAADADITHFGSDVSTGAGGRSHQSRHFILQALYISGPCVQRGILA